MNENNDNFGLDNIQPLEPITPVSEPKTNTNVFGVPSFYTEPKEEESNTQYAFASVQPKVPVETEVSMVSPVEMSVTENTTSNYMQTNNFEQEAPLNSAVEVPVMEEHSVNSYTEMPTIDSVQHPMISDVNEHPNAKVELHRESAEEIPVASNLPREKMDKGTFWLLICLFVGLLIVIIALPYVFDLF